MRGVLSAAAALTVIVLWSIWTAEAPCARADTGVSGGASQARQNEVAGNRRSGHEPRPTVAFVTGHGEPSPDGELSVLAETLRERFEVTDVNLEPDSGNLAGFDVLIVAGRPDIPDAELYELDQFIMRGGRALFLLDAAVIPESGTQALISDSNIFGYLEAYGIVVNPDLVLDRTCSDGAMWGDVRTSEAYPFWPVVPAPGIDMSHPAMSGVVSVPMAWTSSITAQHRAAGRTNVTVLLRSSHDSWTVSAQSDIGPRSQYDPPETLDEVNRIASGTGFPLAVSVEGKIESAFAGKPVIVQTGNRARFVEPSGKIESSAETKMVVFGSSLTFRDDLVGQLPGDAEVLAGVVAWLASEGPSQADGGEAAVGPEGAPRGLGRAVAVVLCVAAVVLAALVVMRRKGPRSGA